MMAQDSKKQFTFSQSKEAVSIKASHVEKMFGNRTVLRDIDLFVKPGEIFVLMGPSGTGKSVFLRLLAGLDFPTKGTLTIDNQPIEKIKKEQSLVLGLVFQSGALFNSLTVLDNLALYLREHRIYSEEEIIKRVYAMLDMLGLQASTAQQMPSNLSGGMRKRVALARGLLMEPDVLLFDEPTSELDPITSASIIELIGYVNKQFNITTFIVSHDITLAKSIGQHIAILQNGTIKEVCTPETLVQSKEEFVQEFLNPTINLEHPKFLSRLS